MCLIHELFDRMLNMCLSISQAKRGKDVGAEGSWDDVTEDQLADLKKAAAVSRKVEQKILADRQASEWDKALDKGRVKKTMKDKEDKALLAAAATGNAFQAVQNERGDKKEYSHSSYFNKRDALKIDGGKDDDGDWHSGERTNEDAAAGEARGRDSDRNGGRWDSNGGRGSSRGSGRGFGGGRDGGRGSDRGRGRGRDGGRGGGRGGRGGGGGRDGSRGGGRGGGGRGGGGRGGGRG